MPKRVSIFLFFVFSSLLFSCKKDETGLTISVSPDHPTVNTAVTFTSSQSGGGWEYHWSFGDTNTNVTSSSSTSHTYTQTGTYTVALTLYRNGSPNGTASTQIIVQ